MLLAFGRDARSIAAMMDFDRKHGLAFLLSLSAVPMLGCPSDDPATTGNDDGSSSSSTNGTVSNSTTMSTSADASESTDASVTLSTTDVASTTDTDSSGSTGTDASSSSGAVDSSSSSGDGSSSSGDSGSSESGVGPIDPACAEYAAHYVECFPKYASYEDEYAAYCQYDLGYSDSYSPECGAAFEERLACLNMADCADIVGGEACPEENDAYAQACGGGSETGKSDGGDEA